jgi:hypothetical protein
MYAGSVNSSSLRPEGLGACPRTGRGRVPGLEGADARRRDAGDIGAHRRGAPTKQMPLPSQEPEGRMGVARRSLRCSSSTMRIDIASSSRLALAVQAPCARPLRILGQAPRLPRRHNRLLLRLKNQVVVSLVEICLHEFRIPLCDE